MKPALLKMRCTSRRIPRIQSNLARPLSAAAAAAAVEDDAIAPRASAPTPSQG
jgi:hypothetical protein